MAGKGETPIGSWHRAPEPGLRHEIDLIPRKGTLDRVDRQCLEGAPELFGIAEVVELQQTFNLILARKHESMFVKRHT